MDPERWRRVRSVFEDVLEREGEGRATTIRRACGDGAALRAELRFSIGGAYYCLTRYAEAEEQLRRARRRFEETQGPDGESTIAALHSLGLALSDDGGTEEAEPLLEEAVARARDALGESPATADAERSLGMLRPFDD